MTARLDLFRAIEHEERESIRARRRFTNLPGINIKYFSLTLAGTRQFARMATASLGLGPFTSVQSSIETALIRPEFHVLVDRGISAVALPTELLPCCATPVFLDITP